MEGLEMIPRKGKPPLLVRQLTRRGKLKAFELHWVLVQSVTIKATHWLTRGVDMARAAIHAAFRGRLWEVLGGW